MISSFETFKRGQYKQRREWSARLRLGFSKALFAETSGRQSHRCVAALPEVPFARSGLLLREDQRAQVGERGAVDLVEHRVEVAVDERLVLGTGVLEQERRWMTSDGS
jgi:hypothetical protein